MILPRYHYLFTSWTLTQCLCLPYDHLTCLIHSIEEAIQVRIHHDTLEQRNARRFFSHSPDSSDTLYTPSTSLADSITSISNTTVITYPPTAVSISTSTVISNFLSTSSSPLTKHSGYILIDNLTAVLSFWPPQ